jgi:hypothetical protein
VSTLILTGEFWAETDVVNWEAKIRITAASVRTGRNRVIREAVIKDVQGMRIESAAGDDPPKQESKFIPRTISHSNRDVDVKEFSQARE